MSDDYEDAELNEALAELEMQTAQVGAARSLTHQILKALVREDDDDSRQLGIQISELLNGHGNALVVLTVARVIAALAHTFERNTGSDARVFMMALMEITRRVSIIMKQQQVERSVNASEQS